MLPKRLKTVISRADLRPELVQEMSKKENEKSLCAETDIIPYFFYMATKHKPLSLDFFSTTTIAKIFESAFRADTAEEEALNIQYANECARYILNSGYIPYGSHIKYTNFLKDADTHERTMGIVFGKLEEVDIGTAIVFPQRGISIGMIKGLELHHYLNKLITVHNIKDWPTQDIILPEEDAENQLHSLIIDRRIEIFQEIDEIIGVKTI